MTDLNRCTTLLPHHPTTSLKRQDTRNAKTLIPLTAAALFAVCAGSMLVASHSLAANAVATTSTQATTQHIVDLPAVTVRPSVEDMQIVAIGAATLAQQLASR